MTALLPPLTPTHSGSMPAINRVYHTDALTLLKALPDGSVDAIVTDPPYGMGIDEWDKSIDIPAFLVEVQRVIRSPGFFAFTIQMPMMLDWLIALRDSQLRFKDHVVWVKRKHTNITSPLCRAHESVFVYATGSAKYFQVQGKWEDVKLPGLAHALMTIEGVDRYVKDMRNKVKHGAAASKVKHGGKRHDAHSYMDDTPDSDRSPEMVNFTNVWSFLPENGKHYIGNYPHATMKPLLMFERMIELLTAPDMLVCDPFAGSGTTLLAARNQGRSFIGCDTNLQSVEHTRARLAEPYTASMFVA